MGTQANTQDISAFLAKMKRQLSAGNYDFVPRRKNMQALAQHGLTILDAKDVIFSLTVGDYYKGPKQDLDPHRLGDIWEFKKNGNEKQFYIKVKIVHVNGEEFVKCRGFHEDDYS